MLIQTQPFAKSPKLNGHFCELLCLKNLGRSIDTLNFLGYNSLTELHKATKN
nr:MAG TPA: hypothetical protein [Caudoviricetes sp.]